MTPKELIAHGDNLFGKRGSLLSMWQSMADSFYVERADFTVTRSLGDDFADHLLSSYPLLVRRDLGNSLGTMSRPTNIEWFHMGLLDEEREDQPGKAWMEYGSGIMRRAMYDRKSLFTRASKEGDHDIATFGQCVKSIEMNRDANGLLYRCWHPRDVAWCENAEGKIDTVHRKWKPDARTLAQLFEGKIHAKVQEKLIGGNKDPYCEISCRHIVMPASQFDGDYAGKGKGHPFVSIYLDVENQHIMEATGQRHFMYVIPRWQTVSGSQYAFSPATVIALPEARLLQAMTLTLLEAGEKAVNPPMVAVQEAIRSDISIFAGGITYVDEAYDEKTGEVLRPISQDKSALPFGAEMRRDNMLLLREAFYLDKLSLPERGPEMTAYEVGQRVQDYIRNASPIFEPLEHEDNGAVCETTFELMMSAGAFGAYEDIPQSIRGEEIGFRFESPLHDAIERQKGVKFGEALQLTTTAAGVDPSATQHVDFTTALRDTLTSIGMPAKWLRSEDEVKRRVEEDEAREQAAQTVEDVMAASTAAEQVGKAAQAIGPEALAA